MFAVWKNWETLGKHAQAVKTMKVSGKTLPRFVDVDLPARVQSQVVGKPT